jgi:hypothetical protein
MIGRRSAPSPALLSRHSDIVDAPVAAVVYDGTLTHIVVGRSRNWLIRSS